MKLAVFDTHRFEKEVLEHANRDSRHELVFFEARLTPDTAPLSRGFPAVCSFANDVLNAKTLGILKNEGVRLVALRSAGFNHVDLGAAGKLGLTIVRVPKYSPYSVAEHAMGLVLSLNRKIHRAHLRVREMNFSLDGLVGFDLNGKTVGVIGTGRIGAVFTRIALGFGCRVLAHDPVRNADLEGSGVRFVELSELLEASHIVSLHVPLTPQTRHLIDSKALKLIKRGALLINTGRGALVDTAALVVSLKSGHLGGAGLDVYEEEEGVFFKDLADQILQDDQLARLLTFPNVLITSHQGFLTREALDNIAITTLDNVSEFEAGRPLSNEVRG